MWLGNLFNKHIFTGQAADDSRAGSLSHAAGEAHEQSIRKMHYVGTHLAGEPADKFFHFLPLVALFTLQCRDRQRTEAAWPHCSCSTGKPLQQPSRVEKLIKKNRCLTKERNVFLQPDVHAPQHNFLFSYVLFVGGCRHVSGYEDRIPSPRSQRSDQRVVVQARAADPAAGSGRDVDNAHD